MGCHTNHALSLLLRFLKDAHLRSIVSTSTWVTPSGLLLDQCPSTATKEADTVFLVLVLPLCQLESEILPSQAWVPLWFSPILMLQLTFLKLVFPSKFWLKDKM